MSEYKYYFFQDVSFDLPHCRSTDLKILNSNDFSNMVDEHLILSN